MSYENDTLANSAGKPGERNPIIRPGLPLEWEKFSERVTRLCLHQRLGTIGVGQWRPLMDRHKALTDDQLLAEVLKLEQDHRRQDDLEHHAPFTRQQWVEFCRAMASLRDPNVPHLAREPLLRIGEAIEARQRPNAERMGWM